MNSSPVDLSSVKFMSRYDISLCLWKPPYHRSWSLQYFIYLPVVENSTTSSLHILELPLNLSVRGRRYILHPGLKYCHFNRPFSRHSMWNIHWQLLHTLCEPHSCKILRICLRMSYNCAYFPSSVELSVSLIYIFWQKNYKGGDLVSFNSPQMFLLRQ
jgi:hypothetical protein